MKYETYARYRDMRKATDSAVARMCGIPKSTMSQWKHGLITPKQDTQIKIADALDIPRFCLHEGDTTKAERRKKYGHEDEDKDSGLHTEQETTTDSTGYTRT